MGLEVKPIRSMVASYNENKKVRVRKWTFVYIIMDTGQYKERVRITRQYCSIINQIIVNKPTTEGLPRVTVC